MDIVVFIGLVLVGVLIGWLLGTARSKENLIRAEARLEAHQTSMQGTHAHFQSVAGDVVRETTEQLLLLAEEKFKAVAQHGKKDMEARQNAIQNMVKPIGDSIDQYQKLSQELERSRVGAYQALKQQVDDLRNETRALRESSLTLSTALRGSSKARGQWGQTTLKNVAEAAGMLEHCDFGIEVTLKSGADGARVDLLARIPGGGAIPVDAKVPLAAYWDGLEKPPEERGAFMTAHAKAVRFHVDELAKRNYSALIEGGSDFTVLFIPAEPILSAAFEADPGLQEYAFGKRILIATPVTIIALLRTVSMYWQQQTLAENARKIYQVSRELYDRAAKFGEELNKVGKGLDQAVRAYNTASGSYDRRLVTMGRKLDDLSVSESAPRMLPNGLTVKNSPRVVSQRTGEEEGSVAPGD